tara:strand:+ start:605 stop:739 length:135 start_codon:yes stop_codon:yes gene_type:complete
MDDDKIDMSVGDELEVCNEGKKPQQQPSGVINYIKKKIVGKSMV